MALGAEHAAVDRLILKEAGWLISVGIGLGTVGAVAAATLARTLLFGVSSWDVQTIVTVAVVLGIAAVAASFVPARRATSVNPVEALRTEQRAGSSCLRFFGRADSIPITLDNSPPARQPQLRCAIGGPA